MNIGLVTESYLPHVNGVVNLVQALKHGLEAEGHTVHVFAPREKGYRDREPNVHRFPMFGSFGAAERLMGVELGWKIPLPNPRRFRHVLATLDVLHMHHMFVLGMALSFYAKQHGIPVLFTNHTNYREFESILPARGLNTYVLRAWFWAVSRLCTRVISPGQKMKEQLRDYGIHGPIDVIPNGISLRKFTPPAAEQLAELKERWDLGRGRKVLVYVGRLSKEKNLDFLVRSLHPLLASRQDVRLLFVGGGPIKRHLEALARRLSLEHRIVFTGYVPYLEIERYYFLADLFVTASLSEVFPLTVIEALSSSLPVIAIDAVGTGDIVADGYNGLLTRPSAEAFRRGVERALDDPDLLAGMSVNAKKSVDRLAVELCIERHVELYASVARRGRAGRRLAVPGALDRRRLSAEESRP